MWKIHIKLLRKSSNSHMIEILRTVLTWCIIMFSISSVEYHVLTQRQFLTFVLYIFYPYRNESIYIYTRDTSAQICNKRWIDSRKISITEIIFIFILYSLLPHNFCLTNNSQLRWIFFFFLQKRKKKYCMNKESGRGM